MATPLSVITIHACRQTLGANADNLIEHVQHRVSDTSRSLMEWYTTTLIIVDQIMDVDTYIEVHDHSGFVQLFPSDGLHHELPDPQLVEAHQEDLQHLVEAMKAAFQMKVRLVKHTRHHTFVVTSH